MARSRRELKPGRSLTFTGYILKPMSVTLKTLLRAVKGRPRTVLYPHEPPDTPDLWRGLMEVDWSQCIGCGLCSRVCPNQCITMEAIPEEEVKDYFIRSNQDEKKKKVDRPAFDIGRCCFCGNCMEYCPTEAITMDGGFELANTDRDALKLDAKKVRKKKEAGSKVAAKRMGNRIQEGPVLNYDKCRGCSSCVRVCSVRIVEMVDLGKDEKGKKVKRPIFEYEECIGCGACVSSCKFNALEMDRIDLVDNDPRVVKGKEGKAEPPPAPEPKPVPKPELASIEEEIKELEADN
jgi:formate hydrogenlyase subunit 6/NADH:ubiquinone oxidoreductase subunit I